jgi:hypothetical protein
MDDHDLRSLDQGHCHLAFLEPQFPDSISSDDRCDVLSVNQKLYLSH